MLKEQFSPFKLVMTLMVVGALLILTLTSPLTSSVLSVSSQGESNITDISNVDPNFDAKAVLGKETLEKLKKASPDAVVSRDSVTGQTIVTEQKATRSLGKVRTEPSIPEDAEVIPPSELSPPGLITPQAVIGTDNRSQITNVNAYPYKAIVFLEVTYASGAKGTGSGAFVSPTGILTAGHVIYSQTHGWATSVKVIPGGPGSTNSTATTSDVVSVNAWVNDANWEYDYGMVRISSSLNTGHFGTSAESNSNLTSKNIWNYGYPADKTYGTLWYDSGSTGTVWTRRFLHNADTFNGNSGGPVVLQSNYTYIVGIHSDAYNSTHNIATRVTSGVVSFVSNNTTW